ncbi:EAL domain protein, partial [Vibrio harveyi]
LKRTKKQRLRNQGY